ncbi:iron complex transport system substrate-binding protein [Paenibacillus algorifonticola]|uniref:Iron complex transport system substrate-binding protein n=1 Tax=Paenibacillus algorifonticola TaxID=684063 RepID=A0A1I2FLM6_9BACL|nr:Fe(3+) dicitrate ABC transporter substrate-binding protein [Paenibacillus algorifonticola]SFF05668.1 iron complex transport system substrate-binding protein [Paenibacillus algorifonticola]
MKQHQLTKALLFTIIGLITLILSACGNSNSTTEAVASPTATAAAASPSPSAEAASPIVIEHQLGTVTLDKTPERIIVLEFSYTDALMTLGVQPVGVADDSDPTLFMDAVKAQLGEYTSIGSRYEPNIELISSLQPDLIIADLNHHKSVYEQLNAIAPTLVLNDHQADYNEMLSNYSIIAKAVGKEAEGKQRLEEHEAKIKAAQQKITDTNLTILPAVVNPKGFFAHSDHSYAGSFLTALGFTDPVANEESYPQLSLEQLVETNPQAIFLLPTEEITIIKEWEKNPLWQQLDAVTNSKVFTVERKDWALSRGLIGSEKIIEDLVKYLGA